MKLAIVFEFTDGEWQVLRYLADARDGAEVVQVKAHLVDIVDQHIANGERWMVDDDAAAAYEEEQRTWRAARAELDAAADEFLRGMGGEWGND